MLTGQRRNPAGLFLHSRNVWGDHARTRTHTRSQATELREQSQAGRKQGEAFLEEKEGNREAGSRATLSLGQRHPTLRVRSPHQTGAPAASPQALPPCAAPDRPGLSLADGWHFPHGPRPPPPRGMLQSESRVVLVCTGPCIAQQRCYLPTASLISRHQGGVPISSEPERAPPPSSPCGHLVQVPTPSCSLPHCTG